MGHGLVLPCQHIHAFNHRMLELKTEEPDITSCQYKSKEFIIYHNMQKSMIMFTIVLHEFKNASTILHHDMLNW